MSKIMIKNCGSITKGFNEDTEIECYGGNILDSIYIVMPAYNEEANIKEVVKKWYPLLDGKSEKSRLWVADSGSVDRTHEILLGLKDDYPKLEIVSDCEKQHGPKLIRLYKKSIEDDVDYVFQTDSDGQTDPKEFDDFWKKRKEFDAILGNRTKRGDGKLRALVEKVVCILLCLFFGVKVPDANAPFRLMKVSMLKKYIDRFSETYNLPNIMLTCFFAYYKEKICFCEISFGARKAGKNSINIRRIAGIGIKAVKDFCDFRRGMKNA